ncbi:MULTISPECIES: co-chaperone GroES [Paraburkholderia]|jgi:chaperonin GroES|uniref:Co-chaperonin GroES n=2 Tax=Paraburkholderia caribensis TaxID=75105 RepID=A0A9Q6S4S8_9BURK|nr:MULTISPECIES: co-chaperone GroES [Paraburkholderia]GJH35833.1 co-chaperone GroES [Paraburkholderia hospita]ALL70190.1 Heat shock protein 60 family co-chaperone GroES [Paraburkholderia caribensis MBA4]AMV46130.1 molecular chaperone GroES [Paraburkholderia caribensis]MCO4878556.1 co-chaperone GroES [Paraburkholderia caribensis]MDR6382669.1 chaperonin GroES [Paraburkholderia caribensis]
MSLRPLHDRVIVKRLDQETRTASGIVIPDSAAEKPDQGEIVAVGPGRRGDDGKRIEPDLKVGERVLFGKYSGQSVKVDGNELLVLREEDIVAVVQS